jgi:hypothetical protein
MKRFIPSLLVAVVIFVNQASADSLFYGWGDQPAGNNLSGVQVWNDTLGYQFQVGANDLQVFRIWDMDTSNFTSTRSPDKVGIWDSSGSLLASATFTSYTQNSQYLGGSYLAAPITLLAGQVYTIGTQGDFQYRTYYGPSTYPYYTTIISQYASPDATYIYGVRNNSAYNFSKPNNPTINTAFVGSYLEYNVIAVPEPSTYALFGIGAIGLLMVMRKKKTA